MDSVFTASIEKARSFYANFDDVIHDVHHSERVANYAKQIAENIGYEDDGILEVCAFWHDAARTKGIEPHEEAGAIMARDDLLSRGASADVAEKAYEGIRFHKSSASPTTIEGKIIRDADKLDIFTLSRWEAVDKAGWKKEYIEDFKNTIASMGKYPDAYTYDITKKMFEEMEPAFLRFYESVKHKLCKNRGAYACKICVLA